MFGFDDRSDRDPRDPAGLTLAMANDGFIETNVVWTSAMGSDACPIGRSPFASPLESATFARTFSALLIRACDVGIALAALVVTLPLLVMIAALVLATNPGPIFFRHRRVGEGGRFFYCLKFRSMVTDADERLEHLLAHDDKARREWATYHKLSDDPRILPLGRFLRRSSLDELPQLWNVLRGDMSVVGPRPIVPSETSRYGRYLRHYLHCRPGITGLWQISGRSNTTYRRRVALDVTWSRSRSFSFYCWILFMTVPSVLTADGSA